MRREHDFVLEQAAWPSLILEETGVIRRANRAAVQVFGSSVQGLSAHFEKLWSGQDGLVMADFLTRAGTQAFSAPLRMADGNTSGFSIHATTVSRDAQRYFILQFFKDGGHLPVTRLEPPKVESPIKPVIEVAKAEKPAVPPSPAPAKSGPSENEFLLEEAPWPVFLLQTDGLILKANRAAVDAFGSNISRTGAQFASLWLPDDRQPLYDFFKSTGTELAGSFRIKTGLPALFVMQVFRPSTGVLLLQLLKKSEIRTTSGSKPSVGSETQPQAAASPGAAQALENPLIHKQKLDCALQLARSISLDFNNALTSILGHASLLLSKAETGHPWRESLVEIEKSAAKAAEVANDLAAFSRQEKDGRGQMPGNLNTLLERAAEAFRAEHPSITWSMQIERRLCTSNFDEAKMQQALVKLIENAVEAIKNSGRITLQTLNLELTEATQDRTARLNPGNYVCVEISDTGEGIAAEVLPRIFEPFFTTKGKNHRGLGLAWVYGIITNHGGGVAVSSQPGVGTSVRLYLPANKKIVRSSSVPTDDLTGDQTILIVDDEDLLLTMGQMILSSFGYTVITANGAQKALEIFGQAKKPIHLMITDLVMPNMSGRELTEHVQKLSPSTRIIWSSGYVRSSSSQEAEAYLQKPFTSQDLLRKVKETLSD